MQDVLDGFEQIWLKVREVGNVFLDKHPSFLLNAIILLLTIIIICLVVNYIQNEIKFNSVQVFYRKDRVLTRNELRFYVSLQEAVREMPVVILPMLRLNKILRVKHQLNRKKYYKYMNLISRKHIDFTICDSGSNAILCCIELVDNGFSKESREKRDTFIADLCEKTGLVLIKIDSMPEYDPKELNAIIVEAIDANEKKMLALRKNREQKKLHVKKMQDEKFNEEGLKKKKEIETENSVAQIVESKIEVPDKINIPKEEFKKHRVRTSEEKAKREQDKKELAARMALREKEKKKRKEHTSKITDDDKNILKSHKDRNTDLELKTAISDNVLLTDNVKIVEKSVDLSYYQKIENSRENPTTSDNKKKKHDKFVPRTPEEKAKRERDKKELAARLALREKEKREEKKRKKNDAANLKKKGNSVSDLSEGKE